MLSQTRPKLISTTFIESCNHVCETLNFSFNKLVLEVGRAETLSKAV